MQLAKAQLCAGAFLATVVFSTAFAPLQAQAASIDGDSDNAALAKNDLFSGRTLPLTLKAQQLSSAWRMVYVGGATENSMMQAMMFGHGGAAPVYYTRGQTVSVGDQTYLVAYRVKPDLDAPRTRRMTMPEDTMPRLASDAELTLSLLNLRTSGNLDNVRAFNPQTDIETPQDRITRSEKASISNLRQLGLALQMYVQDYDEVYPTMKSATSMAQITAPVSARTSGTVQQVLYPYARQADIFRHPTTKEIYRPNPFLSRKKQSAIDDLPKMVLFYEASPTADNRRAVLYADGHVKRELETDWPRIKKASHIP